MLMLMLPYPISTNRYWRTFRNRMVRSKEAMEFKDEVAARAVAAGMELHTGSVAVTMTLCPPRPQDWMKREKREPLWELGVRRIDLDNAQKVALDALQGIAYENDRQITSLSIGLGQPIEDGGLIVTVEDDLLWKEAV